MNTTTEQIAYQIQCLLSQQWSLAGLGYPPALQARAAHATCGTTVDPKTLEPVLMNLMWERATWN